MAKRPTEEQIAAELEKLKALRPRIRPLTAFGDDNVAAIDAQILVLEEGLNEDDVYDQFWDFHTESAARDILAWVDGEGDLQSAEWEPLAR